MTILSGARRGNGGPHSSLRRGELKALAASLRTPAGFQIYSTEGELFDMRNTAFWIGVVIVCMVAGWFTVELVMWLSR